MQIPFGKRALCTKMATDETADKDRRAYKVPIPGNKSVVVTYGYPLLLGVTQMADGYNFAAEAEEDSEVYLLLYRKRGREPFYELLLDEKYRTGRIFSVFMKKLNVTNLEYNFKINGEIYLDPCASRISGREHLGQRGRKIHTRCAAASGPEMVMTGGMRKHRKQTLEI